VTGTDDDKSTVKSLAYRRKSMGGSLTGIDVSGMGGDDPPAITGGTRGTEESSQHPFQLTGISRVEHPGYRAPPDRHRTVR